MQMIKAIVLLGLALMGIASAHAESEFLQTDRMPYEAFDRLAKSDIEIAGSVIHVGFAPGEMSLPKDKILDWVRTAAQAIVTYYGKFPVQSLRLLLVPVDGARVRGGTTWGYRGAAIRILVGKQSSMDDLRRDWVIVHEMVHLALPDLPERYAWLSEGLAVYIEPIARVQAGDLTADEIWREMVRDMPKGLPGPGDEGLDNTDTWGRKYWGGALFCLRADVDIRKRTGNKLGLQDAMRGVLAAGGSHEVNWSIDRVLATADKAVGLDTLEKLHRELGDTPVATDLDRLWRDLGVIPRGDHVEFDEGAPDATVRKAITHR
jgi:hypothetical protein